MPTWSFFHTDYRQTILHYRTLYVAADDDDAIVALGSLDMPTHGSLNCLQRIAWLLQSKAEGTMRSSCSGKRWQTNLNSLNIKLYIQLQFSSSSSGGITGVWGKTNDSGSVLLLPPARLCLHYSRPTPTITSATFEFISISVSAWAAAVAASKQSNRLQKPTKCSAAVQQRASFKRPITVGFEWTGR